MIKAIQKLVIQLVAGANAATVVLMLLAGYSDRINPSDHPLLSIAGMTFPIFLLINLGFLAFWIIFKWRMAWIPVMGYALAYVPISIYVPLNPQKDVPEDAIKLVSYNVAGYAGNLEYQSGCFEVIRDYLAGQKADIVCIQEENDAWRRDVMREYAKLFPFNDSMVISNSRISLNALGIHTRFPIVKRERIGYNSLANGSVAWWLEVGTDTLIVINNHFESCHLNSADRQQYRQILHGEMARDSVRTESKLLLIKLAEANEVRAPQIRAVREYAEAHSRYPVVVCGDFNDNPISYSRHYMAQQFTDAYAATGKGPGLSFNQKAFLLRIDHVFCSSGVQPFNCKIDSKIDASDHYPATCWLKIGPKP